MEQLFASFMLDQKAGLEIALRAESVTEATPINGAIQTLPASIDFLEGIMHLRDDVIPIINLKKRLRLMESSYGSGAKIAVVSMSNNRYGLLFDDIKEVFRVESADIRPVSSALQSEDRIISALISLEKGKRTVEVLELENLFQEEISGRGFENFRELDKTCETQPTIYSRYVIFSCDGQDYGVPVQYAQEITFCSDINDMFRSGCVDGALQLRGNTIPVVNSQYLLSGKSNPLSNGGESHRILVLSSDECILGMIVEAVKEIISVADNEILPMPLAGSKGVSGIYARKGGGNIMLLDMPGLVCDHMEIIKSLARINTIKEETNEKGPNHSHSHHLITENCYLIFAIDKNFAIEIKDVQEIIESEEVMAIPGATGFNSQIINLRGQIVPVVNLRSFYNYPPKNGAEKSKLIICKGRSSTLALEVDRIATIYKQEEFHATPSLNSQFAEKKDTLDRLIDFVGHDGLNEHVLVVNIDNLVQNHLEGNTDSVVNSSTQGINTTITNEKEG
jgi:purine-binding chemotaxis protein CheW